MLRDHLLRAGLAAIIGLWIANILAAVLPEFAGIWVALPFVTTYVAWNWPYRKETRHRGK